MSTNSQKKTWTRATYLSKETMEWIKKSPEVMFIPVSEVLNAKWARFNEDDPSNHCIVNLNTWQVMTGPEAKLSLDRYKFEQYVDMYGHSRGISQ